ncbi:unnamed protein product [Somion occarium]|uniref:NADP-dependent oxidoreductase domain-containing protein n=1 Tax=Somion occarium TaxID=3059160 RepID=A0ABP1CW96_9APHY
MSSPIFTLNNGVKIPAIGLGTWQSKPEEVTAAVEYAIKDAGYRHIDCAWYAPSIFQIVLGQIDLLSRAYGNEQAVGEGIRRSGVPREEIFVTSKLWGTYHSKVEQALDESLSRLGLDYLDLYLIHWPIHLNPNGNDPVFPKRPDGTRDILVDWPLSKTWEQMEAVLAKGKVKAIGVSNFSQKKLEEILPTAKVVPAVDQLELHLYNPQHELVSYLKSKDIVPQAYSPLGSTGSPLLSDETASALAQKYELNTADVLLGYLVAKGIVALPKSVTTARIMANYKGAIAAAQKLTEEDIKVLDGVAPGGRQGRNCTITDVWIEGRSGQCTDCFCGLDGFCNRSKAEDPPIAHYR